MNDLLSSRLYDNTNFYKAFKKDLNHAQFSVIIESPFITTRRVEELMPILRKLRQRGVRITVNTRDPKEHDAEYEYQARRAVYEMQELDITVLYTVKHHRKLAIIDREILYEGSLNILSQIAPNDIEPDVKTLKLLFEKIDKDPSQAFAASMSGLGAESNVADWTTQHCQ